MLELGLAPIGKKQLTINLSDSESGKLEYNVWRLQALQNLVDISLSNTNQLDYKEDHMDTLIDKYSEVFSEIRKQVLDLAVKNGAENVNIDNYTYMYDKQLLIFETK